MSFGLETVELIKRQEAELKDAELKMFRFSLGGNMMDRIRKKHVKGTAEVSCFGETRLRWFGIYRMVSEYRV